MHDIQSYQIGDLIKLNKSLYLLENLDVC